jgi:hypothetical protein
VSRRRPCRSGKVRYRDRDQALRSVRLIQGRSGRQRLPRRAYQCPDCGGWHLTSRAEWSEAV